MRCEDVKRSGGKRLASLLVAASLAAMSSAANAQGQADLPPWAGAYEPGDLDERGLWQQIDELEDKLKHSKEIVQDDALNAYLTRVLCDTVGSDRCSAARIYVLRNASFNAGMYPNGMMVVHTGLLLRMRNEAELASVLGHEFGHFENRHVLQGFKRVRNGSDLAVWTAVLVGIDMSGLFLTDLFQHSRAMETEADLLSHRYLAASRYSSRASADIWIRIIDEDDARAAERKRRKRNRRTSWLSSHPAPLKRAEYLTKASDAAGDVGEYADGPYRAAMEPYLLAFFDDQLQRQDFAASKYVLEQVAGDDWHADHYVMQGELYRKRGHERDLVTAEESFIRAVELGSERPEMWRGLGLVMMKQQRREEAAAALQTYLSLRPEATDAAMIKMMIGG